MTKAKKEDKTANEREPEKKASAEGQTIEAEGFKPAGEESTGVAEDAPEAGNGSGGEDIIEPEAGTEPEESAEDENTKYLRLAADFQNYKRRMEKERFERYSEGKKDFAADLLPVIDNFDRALKQDAETAQDEHVRAVIEGMAMILKQLEDTLAKNGVSEIEALGADFDPNCHHAVVMEPSGEYESQKVSEVLQKGFRMGDKVIRPSMVKVAE